MSSSSSACSSSAGAANADRRHLSSTNMVPGEDFFKLDNYQSQQPSSQQQQQQQLGHSSSAVDPSQQDAMKRVDDDVEDDDEEEEEDAESMELGMAMSPSSVHIVNPESPDDGGAYDTAAQRMLVDDQRQTDPSSVEHDEEQPSKGRPLLPNGKKTKGRVKIKMEFIDNKLRRYTTFSKRKTGIMKKAYELSTLTGTQVMLLVASETGHVYTFATKKLQPMITSEAGKALIQTCLNSSDDALVTSDMTASVAAVSTPNLTSTDGAMFTTTACGNKSAGGGGGGRLGRTKLGSGGRATAKTSSTGYRSLSQAGLKTNSKTPFGTVSMYASDLPTMVAPVSMFSASAAACQSDMFQQSSDETDTEADEAEGLTPSAPANNGGGNRLANGISGRGQSAQSSYKLNSANQQQQQQQQQSNRTSTVGMNSSGKTPVFSFAGMMPNGGLTTAGGQQQPFGFIPAGIAANGSFMYQMPSGLVYASPTAALPITTAEMGTQAQFMFTGFPAAAVSASAGNADSSSSSSACGTSNASAGGGQQQFITIPVPIPITPQSLLHPSLMHTFQCTSPVKEEQEDDQEHNQAE